MEVSKAQFIKPFQFGSTYITCPGSYAIAYTFDNCVEVPAHLDSRLVAYGELVMEGAIPQICTFEVQSISDPCISVPYHAASGNIISEKWLILKPRKIWNSVFLNLIENENKKERDKN
jgi:hypothetical protein